MDYLDNGMVIEQPNDAYHLTSDAVALARFFDCKTSDTVIDIGCGTGILSLMIADKAKKIFAVDINEAAAQQAAVNIKLNKLSNIEVVCADIKSAHKTIGANTADAIICNPPYFETGKLPANDNQRLARHNGTLTPNDLAVCGTRLLKCGGYIYFCYPANRTAKITAIFENNNFRVREIKFIANEKGVYLALFKCKKAANANGHNTKITAPVFAV
jgi:tRNA1Val (adenine37-N6)-methyltransferase